MHAQSQACPAPDRLLKSLGDHACRATYMHMHETVGAMFQNHAQQCQMPRYLYALCLVTLQWSYPGFTQPASIKPREL